jgi:hypothetical protein
VNHIQGITDLLQANNPFEYRGPVSKNELFIDREEQLKDAMSVCRQIIGGSTGGVLVYGGRGSGKTSFLHHMRRQLSQENIVSIYLPLDKEMVAVGSEKRLFNTILQELIQSATKTKMLEQNVASKFINFLRSIGKIENVEVEFPGFSVIVKPEVARDQFAYIILRDGLTDFLKLITEKGNAKSKYGVIIMLDEGDALLSNPTLLQILRNVFQEIRRIGLVVAGSTKLLDEVDEVFSPIPRFFHKVETGPYPSETDVEKAIKIPINLCESNLLLENNKRLEIRHAGFDRIVREVAGRSPMDINLLGYFSFKNAAEEHKIFDNGNKIVLSMTYNKKIIEEAISQLKGTKKYSEFIANLSVAENNLLKILSKATLKLSTKEAAILKRIDDLQDSLQRAPCSEIVKTLTTYEEIVPNIEQSVKSLEEKSTAYNLNVLQFDLLKKYEIDDNWIRAYFRYSSQTWNADISVSELPFIGIRFIGDGDCVAAILFSIFFPRLSYCFDPNDAMKVHASIGNGEDLYPWRGRRLIVFLYKRFDDPKPRHIAFHLLANANAEQIKTNIKEVADGLVKISLIKEYQMKEELRAI